MLTALIAAATPDVADPVLVILTNGGILGAVFIMSIFGKGLHGDEAYKQIKADSEQKDRIIEQLMVMLEMKVIPAMSKSTQVIQANTHKESALVDRLSTLITKIEASAQEDSSG